MHEKQFWKTALGVLALAVTLFTAGLLAVLAVRPEASGGGAFPAGSWLASLLGRARLPARAAALVCVLLLFAVLFLLSRTAVRHFTGTAAATPVFLLCGIVSAVLLPARGLFAGYYGALMFALPAALAMGGAALLLLAYEPEKKRAALYPLCLVLFAAACGGSLYMAIAVTGALAAGNVAAALRRQSIFKTNLALVLAFTCTAVNVFLR